MGTSLGGALGKHTRSPSSKLMISSVSPLPQCTRGAIRTGLLWLGHFLDFRTHLHLSRGLWALQSAGF